MSIHRVFPALVVVSAAVLHATPAAAWYGHEPVERFRCESIDGRTRHCPVDARGGLAFVRQLSRSPCIEGRSWGWSRRGVWVSEGCRAEFEVGGSGGWGNGWQGGGWGPGSPHRGIRLVRCESQNGRTTYCDVGRVRDVRLDRQLSRGDCIEGYTWGFDRRGLWVSRGCRAEFSVW